VLRRWKAIEEAGEKPIPALFAAMDEVLDAQREQLAIPRRFDGMIKEVWALQPRFDFRSGTRPFRLLEHPRFRAGYDFLLIRAEAGEIPAELGTWWTEFQDADEATRNGMLVADSGPKPKRRRRRRKPAATDAATPAAGEESPA
jgi:poly(A) polymerase